MDVDESDGSKSMEAVMGFGGFGKKARTFDLQAIFEETRRNAQERSRQAQEKEQSNSSLYFSIFCI